MIVFYLQTYPLTVTLARESIDRLTALRAKGEK
jgi:hypothetical protein